MKARTNRPLYKNKYRFDDFFRIAPMMVSLLKEENEKKREKIINEIESFLEEARTK
jgi:hypothetical protein